MLDFAKTQGKTLVHMLGFSALLSSTTSGRLLLSTLEERLHCDDKEVVGWTFSHPDLQEGTSLLRRREFREKSENSAEDRIT